MGNGGSNQKKGTARFCLFVQEIKLVDKIATFCHKLGLLAADFFEGVLSWRRHNRGVFGLEVLNDE
jgi:hypothetical protein